ncbi:MAG: MBL fold metallo-hydrolase [Chloroflexota bacterium]|nr:MBL fold metallo-hydrolase [Chloroflexota bacterium]
MSKSYQFAVGDIQCAVLQEGETTKTSEAIAARYPTVSRVEIEAALGGTAGTDCLNCLYINSGGTRILADVGFGAAGPPDCGGLAAALDSISLTPADIDIVYLTHFHGDHIAGLMAEESPLEFPNARFVTMAAEWQEWMDRWAGSDSPQERRQFERFTALRGRFSFVAAGDSVAPGVTVIDLAGHTLGHSGLLVESGGEGLLHVVDLLHQSFQFARTEWRFIFDSDGDMAVETRRRVLGRCADEGLLTLFYHLEFPGLGRVKRKGDAFSWHPLE